MNPETPSQIPQPDNQPAETPPLPYMGPEQYTVPNLPPTPPQSPSNRKTKVIMLVILLLLAGTAAYAVIKHNDNSGQIFGGSASLNGGNAATTFCAPISSTSLDQESLTTTYERLAKAVAAKNQKCVINLETDFFVAHAKQFFGSSDWITYKFGGRESLADDFSQLPATFDAAKFKQSDYSRATILGENNPPASGANLSYPVDLSKYGTSGKYQITISMILDNGNIKVDSLVVEPQS